MSLRAAILQEFEAADGPLTPKEIFENLDTGTYASVRGELVRMKHRDILVQPSYGVYALAREAEAQYVDVVECILNGREVHLNTPIHRARFEDRANVLVRDLRAVCQRIIIEGSPYDLTLVDTHVDALYRGAFVLVSRGSEITVEHYPVASGEVLGRVVWASRFL